MSEPIPLIIRDEEILARFVMYRRWIRPDGTIKPDAFDPPSDLNLSTTRLFGLSANEVWRIGVKVASVRGKELVGRADLAVLDVIQVGLAAEAAPVEDNPNHAHIVGWPQEKPMQKNLRQELAARCKFESVVGAESSNSGG